MVLFVLGLSGAQRPVDPSTGIIYMDAGMATPMRGWYGGILAVANGIIYEADRPAFGLRGNQITRALPDGSILAFPGTEDFSRYTVAALVGYTPPVQDAQPIGASAREANADGIAATAEPGGSFDAVFRDLGWSGPAVDVISHGSGPESWAEYVTNPDFAAWVQSRRVRMIEEDFGFMRGQYTLFADGKPIAQHRYSPNRFDAFMSRAVEVVGTAILTTATGGAIGPAIAAAGLPSAVAAAATQAASSVIVRAGTDRPITAASVITSALLTAGRDVLGTALASGGETVELIPFEEIDAASEAVTTGSQLADEILSATGSEIIDQAATAATGATVFDIDETDFDFVPENVSDIPDWDIFPAIQFEDEFLTPITTPVSDLGGDVIELEPPPLVAPPAPDAPIPTITIARPSIPTASEWTAERAIKVVTGAASSAIGLVRAWEQRKLPPNTTARTVDSAGRTVIAKGDGLIYTRGTDGKITTSKPATGLPQSTLDGYVIVNNGDGTFTRISPTGGREVLRYPDTIRGAQPGIGAGDGMGIGVLMLAGVAAFALMG